MSRKGLLKKIAQLRDTAEKKHNESTTAREKLDYFCAFIQLKACIEHEQEISTEILQVIPDQYSRITK